MGFWKSVGHKLSKIIEEVVSEFVGLHQLALARRAAVCWGQQEPLLRAAGASRCVVRLEPLRRAAGGTAAGGRAAAPGGW